MRPRRLLLITSNFPRWEGDATTPFVARLAADLLDEGWQVDVLAPHAPGAARHEIMHGVTVRRFRYLLPESQQNVCYGGGALINLRQHKSNWLKVPFLVLFELLTTIRLLATRRYAVVNAHWILPQGFVAAIAGKLTKTPLVTTVHGGDVFDLQGDVLSRFKGWSLRRSAAVTVNSSATRAAALELAPDAPVSTIPMGVDTHIDPSAAKSAVIRDRYRRSSGPLLLFVGRLVIEKGADDVLRSTALLAQELPDTTVVLVGTGQDREYLEDLAAELGVSDRVFFAGWIEPEEVGAYMASADIFVGPSKQAESGWREGLGLVFLEAMAAGTPVVATASGGIPDIVRHERTGLLVDEESPDDIAASVRRLIDDPELRATVVANGRQLVSDKYSRPASARAFAELFSQVREQT